MLTELINFTKSLSDDFKELGLLPKKGLHILLQVDDKGNINFTQQYSYYPKNMEHDDVLLNKCKKLQENAWCINTNKCFDPTQKAIHSCSPFCVAFKRENINGGSKFEDNAKNKKPQIHERFENYFSKAEEILPEEEELAVIFEKFKEFFLSGKWNEALEGIRKSDNNYQKLCNEREQIKNAGEPEKKKLEEIEKKIQYFPFSNDKNYIIFYLDLPLKKYKESHSKYLRDNLFNTDKFNTEPDEEGLIYGTNDFQNGFGSKKPFLLHKTATFDITGRISNLDARELYEFGKVLSRKTLPNPLPIFIYNEEFKRKVIALYKDGKLGFRDLIEELYENYKEDFRNYYLLNWVNTKDGIVFKDFDFVEKFKYEIGDIGGLPIENYFQIHEKGKKKMKFYQPIKTVFDLEDRVLKYLIQNKYHKVDYFSDLEKKEYENRDLTFLSFCKYRKAVYDYVYKSNRNTIVGAQFDEMVFNAIRDDFKNNNEYGIKEKLNYWYSLYEHFHKTGVEMASKLKEYQSFVTNLIEDKADIDNAKEEQFAFAAGQVIYYLLKKSKSDDNSFRLMEPYLQKTNCNALKQNIAEDFTRYKHENFSLKFEKVASFVLSFETNSNIKTLQPQLLSGLFSSNQLFSDKTNKNETNKED